MSGTVSIEHNYNSIKCKYEAKTTLNQVLDEALIRFDLSKQEGPYALLYKAKSLNLSYSFRLLNLPQGAKLVLKKMDFSNTQIRVKFQIQPLNTSKIFKVSPIAKINEFLAQVIATTDNTQYKLQVFNQVYTEKNISESTTFLDLGITEDMAIRVTTLEKQPEKNLLNKVGEKSSIETSTKNEVSLSETSNEKTAPVAVAQKTTHRPIAFTPSSNPEKDIKKFINAHANENEYEVDVEDAKKYQHMLSKMANPLLQKREELEKATRKKDDFVNGHNTGFCDVRFRFPDRSILQTTFQAEETTHALYEFINANIRYENMQYKIHLSNPYTHIINSKELKLVNDLKFSTRTLVVLETDKPGPYFNKNIEVHQLDSFKEETDSLPVATASIDNDTTMKEQFQEDDKKAQEATKKDTKIDGFEKKISKFLRLSKK
ncbi:hypothetical protein ACO0RG_003857 [Hanseniaspora osmophila]